MARIIIESGARVFLRLRPDPARSSRPNPLPPDELFLES